VSKKSAKIAALIESCQGRDLNPHYLGFFLCLNQGLFYEAHDVLEELWLMERRGPNYSFYKGLIQFAGAFVHLQKNRLGPAAALLKLAQANLQRYPDIHVQLDVRQVVGTIQEWLGRLESVGFSANPLTVANAPKISLIGH
jgi:hypothetical protein